MSNAVIVFPVISSIISLMCAGVLARDARRRPRPDKVIWAIAFLMFALAAGADAAGRSLGWTPWLARLYYSTGPALVVMFLAIGELYLLAPRVMARFGAGATVLLSAFWVAMVVSAPIDHSRLSSDGWEAIERGPAMVTITVLINAIGTTIIVGGTGYSVWKFWRQGIMRNRMIGCACIALGTIAVGAGGTLTRLGHYEYLYIAMSVGVALIFAGVLWTRRADVVVARTGQVDSQHVPASQSLVANAASSKHALSAAGIARSNDHLPEAVESVATEPTLVAGGRGGDQHPLLDPGTPVGYIEGYLLSLPDSEIAWICEEWSVPRDGTPVFSRAEAKQVWRMRLRLSSNGMRAFDRHSVTVRRQLAILHDEVLDLPTVSDTLPQGQAGVMAVSVHEGRSGASDPLRTSDSDAEIDMYEDLAVPYS